MVRRLSLAVLMTLAIVGCGHDREGGQSVPAVGDEPGVATSLTPGTTKIDVDAKTGQMITSHLDASGTWHKVDMEAVTRELWNIPPDIKAHEFDFDAAPPPSELSPDEMNKLMRKHYLD